MAAPETVEAQPGGVHFSVDSLIETPLDQEQLFVVLYDELSAVGGDSWLVGFPPRATHVETVAPSPPGRVRVGCFNTPYNVGRIQPGQLAELHVIDPNESWRPFAIECESYNIDHVMTVGEGESYEEALRRSLVGLEPQDDLVLGAYPDYWRFSLWTIHREGSRVGYVQINLAPGAVTFAVDGFVCTGTGIRGAVQKIPKT